MSPDVTEEMVMTTLRSFLLAILPDGMEVVQGQQNRVPQVVGPDYVIFTPTQRTFLSSTNRTNLPATGTVDVSRSTSATFQLDVYGPNSTDNAVTIATLFRDDYGCRFMAGSGVQPLHCDNGQQMPLVNGEEQYEARWTLQAVLQVNPSVSTPMQFADRVDVTFVEADQTNGS